MICEPANCNALDVVFLKFPLLVSYMALRCVFKFVSGFAIRWLLNQAKIHVACCEGNQLYLKNVLENVFRSVITKIKFTIC